MKLPESSCHIPAARSIVWRKNHEIDPVHPTRSAITVAGSCGYAESNAQSPKEITHPI